ncbi:MAG: carbamoyltransferase HypF [Acidobacteriota bacterium]
MDVRIRQKIIVKGIVQGVGFRPFVYRLATRLNLAGRVCNNPQGVTIEIEGSRPAIEEFLRLLRSEAPPLARITGMNVSDMPMENSQRFEIARSEEQEEKKTLISPDIAVCDDCLRELFDPSNRRYRYPFINCTNCGPRFTIIRTIPYDRKNTSMSVFTMCEECQKEYDDPHDRRFHAQPNACFLCGPEVWLTDSRGKVMECEDPIREAVDRLKEGSTIAIKGIGGFHLAVDASNTGAIRRLRERKLREEKPLAIMSGSLEKILECAWLNEEERKLLISSERPIVLLRKKDHPAISDEVAPGNTHFGVMLPYTPLHHLLFNSGLDFQALVMTSGNLSEEPIAIENGEAVRRLEGIADYFLMHDREILLRSDDSVMLHMVERDRFLRRSRGFVPVPIFLEDEYPAVIAFGAELKNTVCLLKGGNAFLSQHIGDLENVEAFNFFLDAGEHLKRILEITPIAIAYDLHPEYLNTKHAREITEQEIEKDGGEKQEVGRRKREGAREKKEAKHVKAIGIQHHHAHIVSCLAENSDKGPVIGLAMDGLGYGTDGALWGGEVLIADYTGFERFMTFKSLPMPGGTAAIKEPWRMAASALHAAYGDEIFLLKIPFIQKLNRSSLQTVVRMIQQKINSPLTSGLGRVFDAVAALLCLRSVVSFEGQAPFELEMSVDPSIRGNLSYGYSIIQTDRTSKFDLLLRAAKSTRSVEEAEDSGSSVQDTISFWYDDSPSYVVGLDGMFREIVADIWKGKATGEISAKFHNTVVSILAEACSMLRLEIGFDKVALSGGVFQNKYLFENLVKELKQRGFEVLTHSLVPANDGGISLGQAVIAASILNMTGIS